MGKYFTFFVVVTLIISLGCKHATPVKYELTDARIRHFGRTFVSENGLELITSASGIVFDYEGDSCSILFNNLSGPGNHGYASIELDGQYVGRYKISDVAGQCIRIGAKLQQRHVVKVFKATEAQNGRISIQSIEATRLVTTQASSPYRIEFIGNSITCGMGSDTSNLSCGAGQWYDQHNAYFSYACITARALNAIPMLSAVSGIGAYRNWNSEGPVMPDVYTNLELGTDSTQLWNFGEYTPDIVSICLGTNDFSDGDGVQHRNPFDSVTFIDRYLELVNTVYTQYRTPQIVLIASPMLSGEKSARLIRHLNQIALRYNSLKINRPPIKIFQFQTMVPGGCSYHPSKEDHQILAVQLIPFLKSFLKS